MHKLSTRKIILQYLKPKKNRIEDFEFFIFAKNQIFIYESYYCWRTNVGSTCADAIAFKRIASEVVLLDIRENYAEGKALDMTQTSTLLGFNTKIVEVLMIIQKQQIAM